MDRRIIDRHPAFGLRCLCRTRPYRWRLTPPVGKPRTERMCTVCATQLEALGYRVEPIG